MKQFLLAYPFCLPILVYVIVQIAKIVIRMLDPKFPRKYLLAAGGMPSAHAAFVTSVTAGIGLIDGLQSTLFALAFVITVIVLYDATNIRWEAGKHAREINKLAKTSLNPHLGHTIPQVLVGSVVGVGLTYLFLM